MGWKDNGAVKSSVDMTSAALGCEPLDETQRNSAPVGPRDRRSLRKICSDLDAPENAPGLARHHVTSSQPPTRQPLMPQEDVLRFFGCPSHPPSPLSKDVAESAALPSSSSPYGSRQRPLEWADSEAKAKECADSAVEWADSEAKSKSSCAHAHPRGTCASTCGENEGLPSCLAMRHNSLARNDKDFQIRTDSILSLTMTDERLHDIVRHLADSPRTPTRSGGDSLRKNIAVRDASGTF